MVINKAFSVIIFSRSGMCSLVPSGQGLKRQSRGSWLSRRA